MQIIAHSLHTTQFNFVAHSLHTTQVNFVATPDHLQADALKTHTFSLQPLFMPSVHLPDFVHWTVSALREGRFPCHSIAAPTINLAALCHTGPDAATPATACPGYASQVSQTAICQTAPSLVWNVPFHAGLRGLMS